MNSSFFCPVYDLYCKRPFVYDKMHYFQQGCLAGLLKTMRTSFMDERMICSLMFCLASGLEELHKKGIIHRNIKPQNLLLDGHYGERLRISDLGTARKQEGSAPTSYAGTLMYLAPEQEEEGYDVKVDIWAIGAVLYEIITHKFPVFMGATVQQRLNANLPTNRYSLDLVALLVELLTLDPQKDQPLLK